MGRLMTGRCLNPAELVVMSRIRIADLPHEETLPEDDLRQIFGAGLSDRSIRATRNLFASRNHETTVPVDGLINQPHETVANPFLADRDSPLL